MEEGLSFARGSFSPWLVGSFGLGTVEEQHWGECEVANLLASAIRKQGRRGAHALQRPSIETPAF